MFSSIYFFLVSIKTLTHFFQPLFSFYGFWTFKKDMDKKWKKKYFSFSNDWHINETNTQSKSINKKKKIQSLLSEGWQIDWQTIFFKVKIIKTLLCFYFIFLEKQLYYEIVIIQYQTLENILKLIFNVITKQKKKNS